MKLHNRLINFNTDFGAHNYDVDVLVSFYFEEDLAVLDKSMVVSVSRRTGTFHDPVLASVFDLNLFEDLHHEIESMIEIELSCFHPHDFD